MVAPGVAAGPALLTAGTADPSVLLDAPGPIRAATSFLLVSLFGAGLLARRGPTVERAVDRTVDGSPIGFVYGVLAFGLVAFVGGYVVSQAVRVGLGGTVLLPVVTVLLGVATLTLAGLGYTVVGTWLTEIEGSRRPWPGAVVGAVLSALPWLVLPPLPAAVVWIAVAAVGLGSPTRRWVHGERTVETEADD
jgi:hypothetical protein